MPRPEQGRPCVPMCGDVVPAPCEWCTCIDPSCAWCYHQGLGLPVNQLEGSMPLQLPNVALERYRSSYRLMGITRPERIPCPTCEALGPNRGTSVTTIAYDEDGDATGRTAVRVCQVCIDYARMCNMCGSYFTRADLYMLDNPTGYRVCVLCYADMPDCSDCGAPITGDVHHYNDEPYCMECYRERYIYCSECGESHPIEDGPCAGEDGMYPYSYKPNPIFYDVHKDRLKGDKEPRPHVLYMGLELEVEAYGEQRRDSVERICASIPNSYCKEDGSLSRQAGFEFVTHPLTLDAWKLKKDGLGGALKRLRRAGDRSFNTESCGLHIHLSRTALSGGAHLFKILSLIYSNPRWIYKLSRRQNMRQVDQYASLKDCNLLDLPKKASQVGYPGRYSAVNVGYATVELRFFKGTLAVDGVYRALEFGEAVVEWTRDVSTQSAGSLPLFIAYIQQHKKRYPTLAAWTTNRDFSDESTA